MSNICKLLINVVISKKPKMLKGFSQKASGKLFLSFLGTRGYYSAGGEADSKSFFVIQMERGKPVFSLYLRKVNRKGNRRECGYGRSEKANDSLCQAI